ncbi:alpha/beta hydrolase [Paraburkholderia sp. J41]|uniref:alpha/beta fold hydrolase n=1 Tax=Paraburkholderia sp. J41 TaxID=2805433 RepID=UPI002AC34B88|nr:alpha/beta hydrolase [Paraburkholderia sp. J41]
MDSITVHLPAETLELAVDQKGGGRPLLLLHGGAGPASMRPLFGALDEFHVILPTHPGFDATKRPTWLASIAGLADCYLALLDQLELHDVILVGNSVGGWIAAEMATRRPASVAGCALIDAVGLQPTGSTGTIGDPRTIPFQDLIKKSFANPSRAPRPSPDAMEQIRANQQALMIYAGDPFMHDPSLAERLPRIEMPSLVLWGRQDGIVTPEYGEEYAQRIPGARFQLVDDAGHLPQVEQPALVARAIRDFISSLS